jgi:hypothetical protein
MGLDRGGRNNYRVAAWSNNRYIPVSNLFISKEYKATGNLHEVQVLD